MQRVVSSVVGTPAVLAPRLAAVLSGSRRFGTDAIYHDQPDSPLERVAQEPLRPLADTDLRPEDFWQSKVLLQQAALTQRALIGRGVMYGGMLHSGIFASCVGAGVTSCRSSFGW